MTHVVSPVCGFRSLPKDLGAEAPHLYPEYSTLDWFEPLQYVDDGKAVRLSYPSGRIERDANEFHWYDASNRWEIHGRTVSDIVLTHVPAQGGIDDDVYYRHELMYATGRVDGVEVSGYAHQDFAYGPPKRCTPNSRSPVTCKACGCLGCMSSTMGSWAAAASGRGATAWLSGRAIS